MITSNKRFETKIVNLEHLKDFHFSIPTYQRPFVWGDEQLKKLLDDFYKTFSSGKHQEYFIGTFLTKENDFDAELIDGQQRFTTMWLISFVINKHEPNSKITNFLKINNKLRLSFDIREEVTDYFKFLLDEEIILNKKFDEESIKNYPYLKNIANGLTFIEGYIKQLQGNNINIEEFGNYIYEKIFLIKNTTPNDTDLNKLFSIINSAGVQLEQTDIVKANLLSLIDEKVTYGKIWEACENMNNFFERNVRASFPLTNFNAIDLTKCISFDPLIFKYEFTDNTISSANEFSIDGVNLTNISPYNEPAFQNMKEDRFGDSEELFCRSIINFGQLLLHTYRLHLKNEGLPDFEGTFHINRLIEVFKTLESRNDEEEIKRFFLLLWEVRFLFDKYVVKWITDVDNKSETLELVNFNKNEKTYYSRSKYGKHSILMLQSVLYFTGDYLRQFWLTSYLGYLIVNHNDFAATHNNLLLKLEMIDNSLSTNKSMTDKEASLSLIDNSINGVFNLNSYLSESNGTKFQHYWFQKLEYILWKNWDEIKTSEFENFRIMSRNSVEHIYPQNPENLIKNPPLGDENLHSFGNLVLLSVAQNSEYSRKSFEEKRGFFKDKNSYDTLKSYYIFTKNQNWGIDEIVKHRDLMIEKLVNHYNNIK
jgi:uncharacterized protein with ParB-like and HNH nuclease domain